MQFEVCLIKADQGSACYVIGSSWAACIFLSITAIFKQMWYTFVIAIYKCLPINQPFLAGRNSNVIYVTRNSKQKQI